MGLISLFGAGMAMQFEKHGTGYVYRANGTGPALPVSEAEFERFVFKGGVSFLLHVAAFFLCVVAAAMVTAMWFPQGDEAGGFVLMGAMLVAIGWALYRSVRWSLFAPARALADRAAVSPARPASARPRPRLAGGKRPAAPAPKPRGGWLLVLLFAIAEFIGGLLAALFGYQALFGLGYGAGLVGGLLFGVLTAFLIDRWCQRVTRRSPTEFLQILRIFD
ncbi:hypothetical protein RZN05_13740 [Sphingomonas sp. HF-S4]|uniref:Uncharacterized protein n=1 Tax=Sphingomonas agrestis TaxID=3080540 RepID=A0ABU3Y9H0_9SPHN|nr:hypothetical protein [Sphingomonas sp. HF-S4]MDV3458053.1 hypothetical protein [Sphingomonas sp. HF-S4]